MNEILKRLEIIKSSIAIDDEDIIELQVMKLNKLSLNIEIKNIISKLENHVYSSALFDIENYLKRYSSVVEYIDTEVQSLKLELKSLENKLQTLSEQKIEYLNDIEAITNDLKSDLSAGIFSRNVKNAEDVYRETISSLEQSGVSFDDHARLLHEQSELLSILEEIKDYKQQREAIDQKIKEVYELLIFLNQFFL